MNKTPQGAFDILNDLVTDSKEKILLKRALVSYKKHCGDETMDITVKSVVDDIVMLLDPEINKEELSSNITKKYSKIAEKQIVEVISGVLHEIRAVKYEIPSLVDGIFWAFQNKTSR